MMAHERPSPVHGFKVGTLPNGDKVDFGNSNKSAAKRKPNKKDKKRIQSPSLPDGTKPVFESNDSDKRKEEKPKKKSSNNSNNKKDDAYAGTTFHSSPEAMRLPKPTFKSSPKLQNPVTTYPSPYYPPPPAQMQAQQPHQQPQTTTHQQQSVPQAPGQGPVPMYMPHMPMPVGMPMMMPPPQPPHQQQAHPQAHPYYQAPQPYQYHHLPPPHLQQPPPHHPVYAGSAPVSTGQKISFNELLGSGK